MISILDYGLGNLGSVLNMFKHIRIPAKLINTPADIMDADAILLPGVGSFDVGMKNLKERDLVRALNEKALHKKTPILGICLGAQLLMDNSEEGVKQGLGWIPGNVLHFSKLINNGYPSLRIPHMGWSAVRSDSPLFKNMDEDRRFYYVHSYYLNPKSAENILCLAHYGADFVAGVQKENITGVQFHPEKSHQYGMQFFKNYYAGVERL